MSSGGSLLALRLQLDDAITYGSRKQAARIAAEGLRQARQRADAGEIEYFKAQKYILRAMYVSAIEHLDAAIRHNPADGAAFNDRALCMVELGIIDEAFAYFDKGIAVEPDYATIHHNKGWLLNNIGHFSEAIRCFREALALEPDRAVTYDNLADALYNLGDVRGALEAYKKVLSLLKPGRCRGIRKQILAQIKNLEKQVMHN
ncbi:MAG TPA: tetratricopeptide repeat protein [Candidatus Omnitrophota bacterium]|nr:tetratricopeptide repeat protein [Candidatus Omnitrophota bacterium]